MFTRVRRRYPRGYCSVCKREIRSKEHYNRRSHYRNLFFVNIT